MRKATTLALAFLAATAGLVFAQDQQILFVSGNAWEDGAFPESIAGDELASVGILNDIDHPLVWDTANYSYTWYMRNLVSEGETVFGSLHVATYTGGLFTIFVDWLPSNHDYGVNPPNATVPMTFMDGISTYLDGYFTDFLLNYNTLSMSGTFNGTLNFTGGDVYPLLNATDGWTFGSNLAGVSPTGYDLQLNGSVFLTIVSVEEATWGGVKALYR
jgi:hypothetical protein